MVGLAGIALASGLAGCGSRTTYYGSYDGYNIEIEQFRRSLLFVNSDNLYIKDVKGNVRVSACDGVEHSPIDGRYDQIVLVNVSKGSPFEKYANLEEISKIHELIQGQIREADKPQGEQK